MKDDAKAVLTSVIHFCCKISKLPLIFFISPIL